ncbi:unnamed protein product, partial [Meganyctiphanes norvegica]
MLITKYPMKDMILILLCATVTGGEDVTIPDDEDDDNSTTTVSPQTTMPPQTTLLTATQRVLLLPRLQHKQAGSWGDDPSMLLGEAEEETPHRVTNGYFTSTNNTRITVQQGATAVLRCQVYDVAEHETV